MQAPDSPTPAIPTAPTRVGRPHPAGEATEHAAPRLPYLPGLDGLRAVAVVAVILYHTGVRWLPGGFLGVEVFFVISGFLITALLATEWRQHGRIDLRTFWYRRARRLLPAMFLLLLATLALFVIAHPDEVARVRGDALAAFAYVTNWYFIARQQSYFEAIGRPSPLQHLWSLAIEEQFYLLWPPILALLLRRWDTRRLIAILLGLAAASTLLMAILYRPGLDPSRVYYGTDTRAAGLLLGCALALAWAPWRAGTAIARRVAARLDIAGVVALLALLVLFLRLDQRQAFLYRGGFALVALATAVAIAACVTPGARLLPVALDLPPLRWLGARSYSLYLWHWPLVVLTRPQVDIRLDGLPLLILRLALTILLADLSYRFVETPIRRGALGRLWRRLAALWAARDPRSWRQIQLASVGTGALLGALLALGIGVVGAQPPPADPDFGTGSVNITAPTAEPEPEPTAPPPAVGGAAVPPTPAGPQPCPPQIRKPQITAIGDSVMVAGAEEMTAALGEGLSIDATIGRQASQVPALLRARRQAGTLGSIVIIHVGANGYVTKAEFNAIMAELQDARAVLFLNVRVPLEWESDNNVTLHAGVERYKNAVLLDWYGASAGHPEYLKEDGVHPILQGRVVYGKLIGNEVKRLQAQWAQESGCTLAAPARPAWRGARGWSAPLAAFTPGEPARSRPAA